MRNACDDDACLRRAYRLRLGELNPFQPGATFVNDVPSGPALVAAVPPGVGVRTVDAPDNPDPKPMSAEGRLEEEGGGYVLTTASGAQFVVQNFYFSEASDQAGERNPGGTPANASAFALAAIALRCPGRTSSNRSAAS